jgi:hypothetical protein
VVAYRIPLGLFSDPDGRNITLDVRRKNGLGLPGFIAFNPRASDSGVLTLSPTYRDVGTSRLVIIAYNDLGLHSSVDATVIVSSVNSTWGWLGCGPTAPVNKSLALGLRKPDQR